MFTVLISGLFLVALTTVIHNEVLRALNSALKSLNIPGRAKLLLVIFSTFAAHAIEIVVYGIALFLLVRYGNVGSLTGPTDFSFSNCLYFSAESYTSLGFSDYIPNGSIRLLAGVEALNGLLLIGWSASYIYLAMEKFWKTSNEHDA